MHITPVTYANTYNQNRHNPKKVSFTHHPDFYKFNSVASCYFRHGSVLLSGKMYTKLETLFANVFKKSDKPRQILIAGIGSSQEPFSYMASIKGIIKNKKLKNYVDLYTVDLQSKPSEKELKKQALPHLFEHETFPKYAKKGFVKDSYDKWLGYKEQEDKISPVEKYLYSILTPDPKKETKVFRVNDEIFDFVKETYANPSKSKWESRIQEAILEYPDAKFDIISANNILPYIHDDDVEISTIKQIGRALKKNGYFITDPYEFRRASIKLAGLDNLREVSSGVYQKV